MVPFFRKALCLPFFVLLLLCALAAGAPAEAPAGEITALARFTAGSAEGRLSHALDRDYRSRWEGRAGEEDFLQAELPEDAPCGAVWLKWYGETLPWQVQTEEDGVWRTLVSSRTGFYSDVLLLPRPLTRFRIRPAEGAEGKMHIGEIYLFSPGALPPGVQVWQPTAEKADLLLIACHPDDEVLWFGGALPFYAGELAWRSWYAPWCLPPPGGGWSCWTACGPAA